MRGCGLDAVGILASTTPSRSTRVPGACHRGGVERAKEPCGDQTGRDAPIGGAEGRPTVSDAGRRRSSACQTIDNDIASNLMRPSASFYRGRGRTSEHGPAQDHRSHQRVLITSRVCGAEHRRIALHSGVAAGAAPSMRRPFDVSKAGGTVRARFEAAEVRADHVSGGGGRQTAPQARCSQALAKGTSYEPRKRRASPPPLR